MAGQIIFGFENISRTSNTFIFLKAQTSQSHIEAVWDASGHLSPVGNRREAGLSLGALLSAHTLVSRVLVGAVGRERSPGRWFVLLTLQPQGPAFRLPSGQSRFPGLKFRFPSPHLEMKPGPPERRSWVPRAWKGSRPRWRGAPEEQAFLVCLLASEVRASCKPHLLIPSGARNSESFGCSRKKSIGTRTS